MGRWLLAKYFLRLGDREIEAELEETPEGLRVNLEGNWHVVGLRRIGDSPRYLLTLDDRVLEVLVEDESHGFNLQIGGSTYEVETVRGRRRPRRDQAEQFHDGRWLLRSPLTGVLTEVRIAVGDTVAPGDVLLVIEAMKMLNEMRARVSGTVSAVHVEERQHIEIGELLVEVIPTEAPS